MPSHIGSRSWPTVHPVAASLTPSQAWKLWQAGEITREQFTEILEAWNAH